MPITKEDIEWLRSPEAASEGVTAAELEIYEGLWQRKEKLESKIRSAFADCRLGDGIGLLEANSYDLWFGTEKPKQAREKDERECWERLSLGDLYACSPALCGTDALGYRFLIRAFMLADLEGGIDELIVIHLSGKRDDADGRLTELSGAQLEAIIGFLELFLSDPDSKFHHETICEALKVFWRPLLNQRAQG